MELDREKWVQIVGWFASLMALLMFASYLDQIRLNLSGQKGSIILPVATVVNCSAWVVYALLKEKKDWPIFLCNSVGGVIAAVTVVTAL